MTRNVTVSGNIVDVLRQRVYPGSVKFSDGIIKNIVKDDIVYDHYIIPGFVDSHVHIESSMLVPSEFARLAVVHGTVAAVSDPHEIANVLGIDGVGYMLENGSGVPFKFFYGAPSCVPATTFESSGACLGVKEVEKLLKLKEIKYLSEVMNYPGVINGDPETISKISIARSLGKRIDGHAPGLTGIDLKKYVAAGIESDHESFKTKEGLEKLILGMKLQIREGSCAKNFDVLFPLIKKFPERCMFCSDDKHPDDLVKGQINEQVKRAVNCGIDIFDALRCACVNPVEHYDLPVGLLRIGDPSDFLVVDNLEDLNVLETRIDGVLVAQNGKTGIRRKKALIVNNFGADKKKASDFQVPIAKINGKKKIKIRVITALDGQVITGESIEDAKILDGLIIADPKRDLLKIAVVNRYKNSPPAVGFIKNFGLKTGAIGSSVAHDSHNIIAVGASDEDIAAAVNAVIEYKGGLSISSDCMKEILPLPVAGLMSDADGYAVAEKYAKLDSLAKSLGSRLKSPYMTLSFMALLVVPKLKISDKGLFDVGEFRFTETVVA
jgi:adenine deaminase